MRRKTKRIIVIATAYVGLMLLLSWIAEGYSQNTKEAALTRMAIGTPLQIAAVPLGIFAIIWLLLPERDRTR